ncbi:MAG: DUF2173 family protein [Deltaproteobacteria bacterium]|nr:DUF2173 family protein [Deltaproteobacteria bacterium]
MIGLDRLMKKPGVLAAGQFSTEGEMVRGVGELSDSQMEEVARICGKAGEQLKSLMGDLEQATGMPFKNLNGWVVMGENLALCVTNESGVIVDTKRADFNEILLSLFGPPAAGMPSL